jgi:hypothetical protein
MKPPEAEWIGSDDIGDETLVKDDKVIVAVVCAGD